jgi:hypothetical protein
VQSLVSSAFLININRDVLMADFAARWVPAEGRTTSSDHTTTYFKTLRKTIMKQAI